ncbi:MAG TPA: carboxypeptidase-like regulatory domain-containing protein, partial [Gemmatimonadaceae bacterium]
MRTIRPSLALASLALAALLGAGPLAAQGVTTGAIGGVVRDDTGQPLAGAQVQVVNRATGYSAGALSRASGRYIVPGLEVGSAYTVTARRIGTSPETRENVVVTLGQETTVDFRLTTQAAVLSGVEVTADVDQTFAATRTGVSTTISDSALRRLPTLNRNFTDFVTLTPQISTSGPGLSGGGVNNRYNSIQIDGANASDLFGLGSTGQPGGQARGKSIPLDAVKEYQVLLTPFDVRQGNFAGALINAVTKSGTNDFRATAFYYTRNESLARDADFLAEFERTQYG